MAVKYIHLLSGVVSEFDGKESTQQCRSSGDVCSRVTSNRPRSLAIQSMRSYSYEEWEGREDEPAVVTPLSEKLVSCGKQRHDCKRPWMVCSVLDNLKRFVPASRQVSYVSTTTRLHAKHSS